MGFKDVGYLCKQTTKLNNIKRPKIKYDEIQVFCNIKSISQTEFYQAQSVGLRPEIKVQIKLVDLTDVTHFRYNKKLYKILRVYKKEDLVELVLNSMVIENE